MGAEFGEIKVMIVSGPLSATVKVRSLPGAFARARVSSEMLKSVALVSTSNVLVPLKRTLLAESPVIPAIVIRSPAAKSVIVSPDN